VIWGGNMGMEGKGRNGKTGGKVFEVGIGGRGKNTGVFSKGRIAKGQIVGEGREKGHGV